MNTKIGQYGDKDDITDLSYESSFSSHLYIHNGNRSFTSTDYILKFYDKTLSVHYNDAMIPDIVISQYLKTLKSKSFCLDANPLYLKLKSIKENE